MNDGRESRARILHVDDDPQIRLLMAGSLHELGYTVVTAGTVQEALQLATGMAFDLFILDIQLPDGTGVELCQLLKRLQANAPVAYYTGYADESSEREALSKCGDAYLRKPLSMSEWEETISKLIDRKKP